MLVIPNHKVMEYITNKPNSLKIICNVVGHKYEVSKKVTLHVKEYTCKCCKKQLTTDGKGGLTLLTPKFKEINSILEDIYQRRRLRLKSKMSISSNYSSLKSA